MMLVVEQTKMRPYIRLHTAYIIFGEIQYIWFVPQNGYKLEILRGRKYAYLSPYHIIHNLFFEVFDAILSLLSTTSELTTTPGQAGQPQLLPQTKSPSANLFALQNSVLR